MQINRIQKNQNPTFNARVRVVLDHDGKIAELLPEVRKKLAKGKIPAYLNEYWTTGKNGSRQTMVQIGIYTGKCFDSAFAMPAEKAEPEKLAKAYFDLQARFKKEIEQKNGKGAFENFVKVVSRIC